MAITNLNALIKSMKPQLNLGEYVFCTLSKVKLNALNIEPVMEFEEEEGITVIVEKAVADANTLPYQGTWGWITLAVNSDLAAVGFLAAMTKKLAEGDISVNAVSAFYHDHLFVPYEKAKKAMSLLEELSKTG